MVSDEPETTTFLCALIGTATILKARVASKCHTVGGRFAILTLNV